MEIRLNSEQEAFIQRQIERGRFANADEAIREAVELLLEDDSQNELAGWNSEELRKEIQIGIDQIERGDYRILATEQDWQNLAEDIKARGRARVAEQKAASR